MRLSQVFKENLLQTFTFALRRGYSYSFFTLDFGFILLKTKILLVFSFIQFSRYPGKFL